MQKILFPIFACFTLIAGNATAQLPGNTDRDIPVSKTAVAFSTDSIRHFIADMQGDTTNNYVVYEQSRVDLLRKLRGYNRLMMFAEDGRKIVLHPENVCQNYSRLLEHPSLDHTDAQVHIEDFLADIKPMNVPVARQHKMTAIIFWSMYLGVRMDNNPFDWERRLRWKFRDDITIIKVNIDVDASWSDVSRLKQLTSVQHLLDVVNCPQPTAARSSSVEPALENQIRTRCIPK